MMAGVIQDVQQIKPLLLRTTARLFSLHIFSKNLQINAPLGQPDL
jgi:hypothetical protein